MPCVCYLFIGHPLHVGADVQKCLHFSICVCVSSLRKGHANILCIVPKLTDDPRRESRQGHLLFMLVVFSCVICVYVSRMFCFTMGRVTFRFPLLIVCVSVCLFMFMLCVVSFTMGRVTCRAVCKLCM